MSLHFLRKGIGSEGFPVQEAITHSDMASIWDATS